MKIAYLMLANKEEVIHGSPRNPFRDAVRFVFSSDAGMDIQRLAS